MAEAFLGFQAPETFGSDFNAQVSIIKSILATIHTSTLVKVVACSNNGALSPVGTVDVQPLVNQVDGYGAMVPHGIIYTCPYARIQGGANAIIIDPEPGDIGVMIFSERDISKVIATKEQANPGSNRKFSMADGCYIGGWLNGTPTQYIQFSTAGVKIYSPHTITVQAAVNVDVIAGQDATITATRDITATAGRNVGVTASGNITANATGSASVTANTASITAPGGATITANTGITGNLVVSGSITAANITIL